MKTITYQRDGGILAPVLPYDCPMWELGNTHDSLAIVEAEEFTFPDQIIIIGTLKPLITCTLIFASFTASKETAYRF